MMTEAEWTACADPLRMLDAVVSQARATDMPRKGAEAMLDPIPAATRRRLRLFAVAAARDLLTHQPDPDVRGDFGDIKEFEAAILRAEAYADGQGTLRHTFLWIEKVVSDVDVAYVVLGMDSDVGMFLHDPAEVAAAAIEDFQVNPAHWLRDIFGNPFRPSPPLPPAVLAWNDGTVRRIAKGIYDERQLPAGTLGNARLAILADALLDSGCDDGELIAHCRSEGPHVRGCWGLDRVLGRE
jgi:hypothetical protein